MSAPSRPVVVVLEGISAGQYFADAALKRGLELEYQHWLYGPKELNMLTPILHAVGTVPFTEHLSIPWRDVIRHTGAFSRNSPSGTTLMVETDGMTPQESVAFSCLLGIFGWRQIEYGSYYKI